MDPVNPKPEKKESPAKIEQKVVEGWIHEQFNTEMGQRALTHLCNLFGVDKSIFTLDAANERIDPYNAAVRDGKRIPILYIRELTTKKLSNQ